MKSMQSFLIVITLFFLILFSVKLSQQKKFVWKPTFGTNDYQPFGSAIFDDVMKTAVPGGYHIINSTFTRLNTAPPQEGPIALLLVSDDQIHRKEDINALLEFVEKGNKLFWATNKLDHNLVDTLGVKFYNYFYRNTSLLSSVRGEFYKKLYVVQPYQAGDSSYIPKVEQEYEFLSFFVGESFSYYSDDYRVLALSKLVKEEANFQKVDTIINDQEESLTSYEMYYPAAAITRTWGKGEITLISTPYIFTNYGIMNSNSAQYIFDMLQGVGDLPLYRTLGYNKASYRDPTSPFAYFHSHPPLKRALYFSLTLVLLFFIFTARRRQRAIPLWQGVQNQTLIFVKLIGTLYFQKHNNLDLVCKRYLYFTEQLRRKYGIDINEQSNDKELAEHLHQQTGLAEEWLWSFMAELRQVVRQDKSIDDHTMKRMIDGMREILYAEEQKTI